LPPETSLGISFHCLSAQGFPPFATAGLFSAPWPQGPATFGRKSSQNSPLGSFATVVSASTCLPTAGRLAAKSPMWRIPRYGGLLRTAVRDYPRSGTGLGRAGSHRQRSIPHGITGRQRTCLSRPTKRSAGFVFGGGCGMRPGMPQRMATERPAEAACALGCLQVRKLLRLEARKSKSRLATKGPHRRGAQTNPPLLTTHFSLYLFPHKQLLLNKPNGP